MYAKIYSWTAQEFSQIDWIANKNSIDIIEKIVYSRTSIYNSENENKATAKQCNTTKSWCGPSNNRVDKSCD